MYFIVMIPSEYILVKPSKNRVFEPEKWNAQENIGLIKCFAYAVNAPELGGAYSELMSIQARDEFVLSQNVSAETLRNEFSKQGYEKFSINDFSGLFNAKADAAGLKKIDFDSYKPSPEDHIIAIHHLKQHYWRLDSDGTWSHKDDVKPATNKDDSGNVIANLEEAKFLYGDALIKLKDWPGMRGSVEYYLLPEEGVLVQKPNVSSNPQP